MFTAAELQKMVFFDLETASNYSSLSELRLADPTMAKLWEKRCEYLRSRFEENKELSDDELYLEKAALSPEFNRLVCASFGRLTINEIESNLIIKSYASKNESDILDGIHKVFTNFASQKFCGHNIKRFDVPVMCKRLLISGRTLPKGLLIHNLKPWEMPFVDSSELWSFGAWQEGFSSLELLSTVLGFDSSKDDIRGDEVTKVFWQDNDLSRITKYCEKDVLSVTQILLKLSNLPLVEDYQLQKS